MASKPSITREVLHHLRQHPRDLPERLVVLAVGRQGEPAKAWAEERLAAGAEPREESDRLRRSTLVASRVDGAVAGTPFFVALVPAYVTFLWAQVRMVLRIAALHGRDPSDPRICAEVLALRGVYLSVDDAQAALDRIGDAPPETGHRDRVAAWVDMVRRILVLAAFTSGSNPDEHPARWRQATTIIAGAGIWIVTCLLPLTFMVLMAWSCETSTRQLAPLALEFYSGQAVEKRGGFRRPHLPPDAHRSRRQFVRWSLLVASIALPVALLAVSVVQGDALPNAARAVAGLVGLSLVIVLAVLLRR
jgi:hypothetical protein